MHVRRRGASLVAQIVKHMLAIQETWVQSLGWEDPLEKEMATHSSTLAWKIPWTEEHNGYSLWGRKEMDTTERLHFMHNRGTIRGRERCIINRFSCV